MQPPVNITLDPNYFVLIYSVNGQKSPSYLVIPTTTGTSPFNTDLTPFLLPSALQTFGFNVRTKLGAASDPVYWGVRIAFYTQDPKVIPMTGFSKTQNADFVDANVTPPVQPNLSAEAGFTPIDSVDQFRDWQWQPGDLPDSQPVRMSIMQLAYRDADYKTPIMIDPSNNTLDIWLMRV